MSVAPEIGNFVEHDVRGERPACPVNPGKVQRPALPDNTLKRDRLLDWLAARRNRRVVLVVSEAGFGKTTLIADFTRRSGVRTLWYRLDQDDTGALGFLRNLVWSMQEVDPAMAPRCLAMLDEAAIGPAQPQAILETLLWELDSACGPSCVLVLDDYHMVETVAPIRRIVERLIARAPRHFRFVVISRRTPSLSLAALRARDDLAEIGRDDLRFDSAELRRLFSESYHHPLEADVLDCLQAKTEGWAASLQLIRTAVDRLSAAQTRSFVSSMSGAHGGLYDYLAEEVVGDLQSDLRAFLMRVAVLDEVDPEIASVVAAVDTSTASLMMGHAERLGLLSRSERASESWRAHPLVRDYLLARLMSELGGTAVVDLHRRAAGWLEPRSWRQAARHWAAIGDGDAVRRVVCTAVPAIIAAGDLAAAGEFMERFPSPDANPWYDILASRQLVEVGRHDEAEKRARRAADFSDQSGAVDPSLRTASALNLLYLSLQACKSAIGSRATDMLQGSADDEIASIARATESLQEAGNSGSLDLARVRLLETLRLNRDRGHRRYEAITLLNMSVIERVLSNPQAAVGAADSSLRLLETCGNPTDIAAARLNMAKGLADLGQWDQAQGQMAAVLDAGSEWVEPGNIVEAAELQAMYGDPMVGSQMLSKAFSRSPGLKADQYASLVSARLELHHGRPSDAARLLAGISGSPILVPGFRSACHALDVQIQATIDAADPALATRLCNAADFAYGQQAWFSWKSIALTEALVSSDSLLSSHIGDLGPRDSTLLTVQAELVLRRLCELDMEAFGVVKQAASLRSGRWRGPLRRLLTDPEPHRHQVKRAAELLDLVGQATDVGLLRKLAARKPLGATGAGRSLARRLAPKAYVEDLGRICIRLGDRVVAGTDTRKKVLSLLGYLITRPQYTATREQVLEALWPEMDPVAGANSLNQTVYFLRRIFEPDYDEDNSAGYLTSRADLIWLDSQLVGSRSTDCLNLVVAARRDCQPETIVKLADAYTGRFGVDFLYDEWASAFRDTLHAAFLDVIERAIKLDTHAGSFDRAIEMAQKAIQADPEAEQIELALLRLYRLVGAHAAASEQYGHYVTVMREQLGCEPPPLETL